MFHALRARLRNVLRRDAVTREMEEELREHLEQSAALLERRGMSPEDARLSARQALGNATVIAHDARSSRGGQFLDDVRRDVVYATRALLRTPGFTTVVIVTLALGFGVNGALFAFLRRSLSPSPIVDAATWLKINDYWSWDEYNRIRDGSRSMTEWSATTDDIVLLRPDVGSPDPETIRAQFVTDGFFPALRGRAALGRVFTPAETAPPVGIPVVVLSHALWRRRFNSDSSIIGRDIHVADGQPFTVVGVMPELFAGKTLSPPDVWLPLGTRPRLPGTGDKTHAAGPQDWFGADGTPFLFINARLAPGAALESARSELRLKIERAASRGDSTRGYSIATHMHPATQSGINGPGEVASAGLVLGAAISVLLIASVTVANLMLARAAARSREMGVRLALGADRLRVVRSWMTECFLLSLVAAATGLVVAWWTTRVIILGPTFTELMDGGDSRIIAHALAPDVWSFVYLVVLSIPSTIVFGLVPALRVTRMGPLATMRGSSAGATQGIERVFLRRGLVVSQVALTTILLLVSAMMVRGVHSASRIDPGFRRHDVIAVSPSLVHNGYDSIRAQRFMEEFRARLATIRGVQGVTNGNVPMEDPLSALIVRPGDVVAEETRWNGIVNAVDQNFFDVLGIEVVRGRTFTRAEVESGAAVAVISQRTAETLWPGEEAVGKVISVTPYSRIAGTRLPSGAFSHAQVVGIVRDAHMTSLRFVDRRYVYVPDEDWTPMIRTSGDPEVVSRIRAMTRLIDPGVVVLVRTLDEVIWRSSGWLESAGLMTGSATGMGLLSLLMAVVGLFGLTAYAVEQRTREFGVRIALGAGAGNVLGLVAGQSLRLVAVGAIIGIVGGIATGGLLRSTLFGVTGNEPLTYVAVVLLLGVVSVLACWIPARRATRVDPMAAIRSD
jgi:predicted permease